MNKSYNVRSFAEVQANSWLLQFTDLISLCLVFFVLIFSMSSINLEKYKAILLSINPQQIRVDADEIRIRRIDSRRQVNLDYLKGVMGENFKEVSQLNNVPLQRREGELVAVLPVSDMFTSGDGNRLTDSAVSRLNALGWMLNPVANRVEVRVLAPLPARGATGSFSSGIELGMARSISVTNALKQGGARGDIRAVYQVVNRRDQRIEVVVLAAGYE
ncbi:MAG: hypothetical protein FWF01_04565 [Alphaproteobacteria bacterium]|nr:hypothetical protein [Alphaproteobacteria bacterium]